MGLPQLVTLSIDGVIQRPRYCSIVHLGTKNNLFSKLTEPTIKGATLNEKTVLFSIEKLNNSSQLAILAHQQVILPLASPGNIRKVVTA